MAVIDCICDRGSHEAVFIEDGGDCFHAVLEGPQEAEWPYPCTMSSSNGVNVSASGKLWAAPPGCAFVARSPADAGATYGPPSVRDDATSPSAEVGSTAEMCINNTSSCLPMLTRLTFRAPYEFIYADGEQLWGTGIRFNLSTDGVNFNPNQYYGWEGVTGCCPGARVRQKFREFQTVLEVPANGVLCVRARQTYFSIGAPGGGSSNLGGIELTAFGIANQCA